MKTNSYWPFFYLQITKTHKLKEQLIPKASNS